MDGKIRSLLVRPSQSADLSFNMAGVIDRMHATKAKLGAKIVAADTSVLSDLYPRLGERVTGNDAKLKFSPDAIETELANHLIFALRNQSIKVGLSQLLNQREISFLQRFKRKSEIVAKYQTLYPQSPDTVGDWSDVRESTPISTLGKLDALKKASGGRFEKLRGEYGTEGLKRNTVNTATPSGTFTTAVQAKGHPIFSTQPTEVSQAETQIKKPDDSVYQKIAHGAVSNTRLDEWKTVDQALQSSTTTYASFHTDTDIALASFLHRPTENVAAFLRQRLGMDERELEEFLFSLGIPELSRIMDAELETLDLEVRKLQLNYAHSFLTSPIPGRVTAVYKDIGESVSVGEPVVRVENDEKLLLVGTINFRGAIRVTEAGADGPVTIVTTRLFETADTLTIPKVKIAAIRGQDRDNDEWDVILECDNPVVGGHPILPLNYQFDRDNTRITVS